MEKQLLYRRKLFASGNLSIFIIEITVFFQKPVPKLKNTCICKIYAVIEMVSQI